MSDRAGTLVLLRHGQSTANLAGLFTGMLDVYLTDQGWAQALDAGEALRDAGIQPDAIVTSPLKRAAATARLVAGVIGFPEARILSDIRLVERNYGALTGRKKSDVLSEVGEEQFLRWRRSVDTAPPPMKIGMRFEWRALDDAPAQSVHLPRTESLRDVIRRVEPLWKNLLPGLAGGRTVLVVAHGNSLRALCALIDDLGNTEIQRLNIPTGEPLVYRVTDSGAEPRGGRYLSPDTALKAVDVIAREGGT